MTPDEPEIMGADFSELAPSRDLVALVDSRIHDKARELGRRLSNRREHVRDGYLVIDYDYEESA